MRLLAMLLCLASAPLMPTASAHVCVVAPDFPGSCGECVNAEGHVHVVLDGSADPFCESLTPDSVRLCVPERVCVVILRPTLP